MKLFTRINDIQSEILGKRQEGFSVGFVPTMGALHEGHLSLLEKSIEDNDISLCSIFVNPVQFNNKLDLDKYPRTLDDDCKKLEHAGCDIVFAPSVEEMYPDEVKTDYDFGQLEQVMEGRHRQGHFTGVAVVVKKLFDICIPHKAYFGEKDFQQLMVIRELVKQENIEVEVIGCPIIREADGLAMSSRNVRLSPHERSIAPEIYRILKLIKQRTGKDTLVGILAEAHNKLVVHPEINIEYIEIVEETSLLPVQDWDNAKNIRAFIALFLGDVRLIDNMRIS